jgi:Fanconi-associated nuclease 1
MERFTKEVGEEGLHHALVDLCLPFTAPVKEEGTEIGTPVKEEPEIIDLTFDFDEDDHKQTIVDAEAGPSRLDMKPIPDSSQISMQPELDDISNYLTLDSSDPDIDFFCRDQTTMTLLEVLNKLSTGELKDLVKSIKIKPRKFVVRLPGSLLFLYPYLSSSTEGRNDLCSNVSCINPVYTGFYVIKEGEAENPG